VTQSQGVIQQNVTLLFVLNAQSHIFVRY